MKTNTKRIIAILVAFALGAVLAKNVKAQESDRIRQMEAEIAQLRAELEQLRSAAAPPTPEVVSPLPLIDETSSRTLPAPNLESPGVQQLPDVVLPNLSETIVPQNQSPASIAPSLALPQATTPRTFSIPPTIIESRPTWTVPVEFEYCPLSGISYPRLEQHFYYRVPVVPQYPREWDYWDEDRLGRQRIR